MTSEEYHERLNALVAETVGKILRGESTTEGGMDWEDAERFLKLGFEAVEYDLVARPRAAYEMPSLALEMKLDDWAWLQWEEHWTLETLNAKAGSGA